MSEVITKKQLESSEIQTGACHYCGQIYQFETDGRATEEQLDAWAVEKCDCVDAKIERKYAEKINEAQANVREMIEEIESDPEQPHFATGLICDGIDLLARRKIVSLQVVMRNGYKLSAKINDKGNIKTEISKTIKKCKEA